MFAMNLLLCVYGFASNPFIPQLGSGMFDNLETAVKHNHNICERSPVYNVAAVSQWPSRYIS